MAYTPPSPAAHADSSLRGRTSSSQVNARLLDTMRATMAREALAPAEVLARFAVLPGARTYAAYLAALTQTPG